MFTALSIKRNAEIISGLAALLLIMLLPAFVLPLQWVSLAQSKVLLATALLSIALIGWAFAAVIEGGIRVPRSSILVFALLLPIAYTVSTFFAGPSPASMLGTGVEQDTLAAVCMWYVALITVSFIFSDSVIKNILAIRALFIGALLLALFQWAHFFFPAYLSLGGVIAGATANLFGGWYELGILADLFVFLALGAFKTPVADGIWKYVLGLVALLSFGLLVVINAIEVWVALAVVCVSSIVLDIFAEKHWYRLRHLHTWVPYAARAIVAVAAILFALFGSTVQSHLPAPIQVSTTEVRPSWQGTFLIGSHALTQPSRLAFGVGPNSFMREWALYKPVDVNQTLFWNTDFVSGVGSIPTSLISIGIFGGIAWIFFILSVLWTCVRLAHASPRAGAGSLVETLFLGSLFLIAFHILYVPGPALSMLTFILIGLAIGSATSMSRIRHVIAYTSSSVSRNAFASNGYLVLLLAFVAIGIFACGSIAQVVIAESLVSQSVVVYNTTKDLSRSSDLVAQALRIYPQDARGQRAAVELGLLRIQELAAQPDQDAQTGVQLRSAIENTITYALDAVSIQGNDYQNWLELALLYQQLAGANVGGAYDNAQSAYEKIIAQTPNNPVVYFQRARLELLQNNTTAALDDLSTSIRLKPDFAAAYFIASQVFAGEHDSVNAIKAAQAAVQYAPQDPTAWYNLGVVTYAAADYTTAGQAFQHALSIEPQYANAEYGLGLTYYQLGRVDEAISTFQQLETLTPDQTIIDAMLANLRAGKSPFEGIPQNGAASAASSAAASSTPRIAPSGAKK